MTLAEYHPLDISSLNPQQPQRAAQQTFKHIGYDQSALDELRQQALEPDIRSLVVKDGVMHVTPLNLHGSPYPFVYTAGLDEWLTSDAPDRREPNPRAVEVRRLMSELWREVFGGVDPDGNAVAGYIPAPEGLYEKRKKNDPKVAEYESQMAELELAMALSLYAHQLQYRGTGDKYWIHVGSAALYEARELRAPIRRLIEILLHDVDEDTRGKLKDPLTGKKTETDYPYPMTLGDIGHVFGREIRRVDTVLTETRKTHKLPTGEYVDVKDRIESLYRIIVASFGDPHTDGDHGDPYIAIHKAIGDRLHNIRTLAGKPMADQITIALDTAEFYVPLARLMGFHQEADEMETICFAIIDESTYQDGFANALTELLDSRRVEYHKQQLLEKLSEHLLAHVDGIGGIHASLPTNARISKYAEGSRDLAAIPEIVELTVGIDSTFAIDTRDFAKEAQHMALSVAHALSGEVGSIQELAIQDPTRLHTFMLRYSHGDRMIGILLTCMPKPEYELYTTPLSYVEAMGLMSRDREAGYTFEDRRSLAHEKQRRLEARIDAMGARGDTHEQIVQQFAVSVENAMPVIGVRYRGGKPEAKRTLVPLRSTVFDYLVLRLPDHWWKANAVKINGTKQKIDEAIGMVLQPNDQIQVMYNQNDRPQLRASWLPHLQVRSPRVRQMVTRVYVDNLQHTHIDLHRDKEALRDTGLDTIKARFPYIDYVGLDSARGAMPAGMKPEEFCIRLALGAITGKELLGVIGALKEVVQHEIVTFQVSTPEGGQVGIVAKISAFANKHNVPYLYFSATNQTGTADIVFSLRRTDANGDFIQEYLQYLQALKMRVTVVQGVPSSR